MMIDYNVRDDWADDEPVWMKSLVSSLSRKSHNSAALPLTVAVQEILDWLTFASGEEAWARKDNRASLTTDVDQSVTSIGSALKTVIAGPLATFQTSFAALSTRSSSVLKQGPGMRTDQTWVDLEAAVHGLLAALTTDAAVGACWDDLVAIAKDRTLETRAYQPATDLLFEILERRAQSAEDVFRQAVTMLAYGREPDDFPFEERSVAPENRILRARDIVLTPPVIEPVAVWLGFKGGGHVPVIDAGNVHFFNAAWHIPNAAPERPDFPHKAELAEITRHGGIFKWRERLDEGYAVDFLVRIDLGESTAARAFERAVAIVDTIFAVVIHDTNGIRPHLAQSVVVRSGESTRSNFLVSRADPGFPDDHYGAQLTVEGLDRHAAKIADALAKSELPGFLVAALEAQTAADRPFSREYALRTPSEADRRAVVPLADRVVQHVAAYAAIKPGDLVPQLVSKWAQARWTTDVQNAVLHCLLGGGPNSQRTSEMLGQFYASSVEHPWMLFASDHESELLELCRVEHERGSITRMLRSLRDLVTYEELMEEYEAEAAVLSARRTRVRNALVHGNPAQFAVVESVRDHAEFLSNVALASALDAFTSGEAFAHTLNQATDLQTALKNGQTAAAYWRTRVAASTDAANN